MDFSACMISKGLGPAPVKLGDSSFSTALQIKQGYLSKQNPLHSYFPPSVWPDQIQGNHFNPEVFPDQETLGSVRLTKRPNQDTVKALPELVHFPSGGKWKASPNSAPLPASFKSSAHSILSEQPSWTKNISFFFFFFYQCFFPLFDSDISPMLTTSWVPTLVQDLPSHLPDMRTGAVFTCCQGLHECSSCSLLACCLFGCLQQQRLSSVWQGPQGLTEGLYLMILFQRGLKRTTKRPSPAAWMETQHHLSSVRPVSTGKPRIMANTATPSSVMLLSPLADCLRKSSSVTKVRTF